MSVDPVVAWSLRAALSALFAAAAFHKLRALPDFRITLADYDLVPPAALAAIAWSLALGEALLAVALLMPGLSPVPGAAAAGLLIVYALAMGINLARGREHLSCGCLGPAADEPVHRGLLLRNGVLAVAALASTLPVAERAFTMLDALTLAGSVAGLGLLYVASEALLAASRRMAAS